MDHLTLIVVWRPHDEQGHAVEHPDALVAFFAVGFSRVLTGEQVAVEESLQIGKVNAMILQIPSPLPLVPGVHVGSVYALYICSKSRWRNVLRMSCGWWCGAVGSESAPIAS